MNSVYGDTQPAATGQMTPVGYIDAICPDNLADQTPEEQRTLT